MARSKKKSILVNPEHKVCALCGSVMDPEWHHVMHGTANRSIADKYGLALWLCHTCHHELHFSKETLWRDIDKGLMAYAQRKFEEKHSREEWMKLFMKNYESTREVTLWTYI